MALFDMLGYGEKVYYQDTLSYFGPKADVSITDFSGINNTEIQAIIKHELINIRQDSFFINVIDNSFFNEETLKTFIHETKSEWYLFGMIVLPLQIFKRQIKSVLIMQNIGQKFIMPGKFLVAEIPSFTEKDDMEKVIYKLDDWFQNTEFYRVGEI